MSTETKTNERMSFRITALQNNGDGFAIHYYIEYLLQTG